MTLRFNLLLASGLLVSFLALPRQANAQNGGVDPGPATTIRFEEMEHAFGEILQNSENVHVFRFKNMGSVPLIITNAQGSCGCTVPDYDKAPIAPGQESEIRVIYKPGTQQGNQAKTVTITANTQPTQTLLRITADVRVDPNAPAEVVMTEEFYDFPIEEEGPGTTPDAPPPMDSPYNEPRFDPLTPPLIAAPVGPTTMVRFTEMEHDFGDVLQGSENPFVFRFRNMGNEPLVISNAQGSCGCTVPYYAKEPIPPGAESEIHVVYKPGKQMGRQAKTVTITANTDPSPTVLRITANVLVNDSVVAPSLFAVEEEHQAERKAIEAINPGCFVVFPNPASTELRLDLKEHIGRSAQVRITDQTGREMLQTHILVINSETSRLNVAEFPAGIYIATVQVEGKAPMSQCFVVNR